MLEDLTSSTDPRVLIGIETGDDAGVYQLSDDVALVQTVDFFTPIVDDPFLFGRIAAANALSDVYAMGGKPLTALNIVCFPIKDLDPSILKETLQGGLAALQEANVALLGGHSIQDKEFKYGLSVTGQLHPRKILAKQGARPGDRLILTKPLGTGILSGAGKKGLLSAEEEQAATSTMAALNKDAADVIFSFDVHSCTDITGFGFLGHAAQMVRGADVGLNIRLADVPVLSGAYQYANDGHVPGGLKKNRAHFSEDVDVTSGIDPILETILYDPQTSGGLFFSLSETESHLCLQRLKDAGLEACVVGDVTERFPSRILLS